MNAWLALIPLVSAVIGWGIAWIMVKIFFYSGRSGYSLEGFLLKQQPELSGKLAKVVSTELFSFGEIERKLLSAGNFEKIIPEVEVHIDHFLSVKLKEKMPMVGMFVGERTLGQLKEIFMEELETLFPVIMKNYISGLSADFDVELMVKDKLASIPADKLSAYITELLSNQLNFLAFLGALTGFIIGMVQILFILFFYN